MGILPPRSALALAPYIHNLPGLSNWRIGGTDGFQFADGPPAEALLVRPAGTFSILRCRDCAVLRVADFFCMEAIPSSGQHGHPGPSAGQRILLDFAASHVSPGGTLFAEQPLVAARRTSVVLSSAVSAGSNSTQVRHLVA